MILEKTHPASVIVNIEKPKKLLLKCCLSNTEHNDSPDIEKSRGKQTGKPFLTIWLTIYT